MPKLLKHWVFLIGLILGLLVGAASYYFGRQAISQVQLARASVDWTPTQVRVRHASVESTYGGSAGSSRNYHRPKVRFAYLLEGRSYESSQIYFGNTRFSNRQGRKNAEAVIAPYSNYPTVTAYVNPNDSSQAVLEPGLSWRSFEDLINVALGFVIALAIIVFAFWLDSPLRKEVVEQEQAKDVLIG